MAKKVNPLCAERMKELIGMKRISQRQLAINCFLTPSTICKIMAGKQETSDSTAEAIAAAFPDVSADWIKGEPDAVNRPREAHSFDIRKAEDRAKPVFRFLNSLGYKIDREDHQHIDNVDALFYPIRDKVISQEKLTGIVDDVIALVSTYMDGVIRDAHTREEIVDIMNRYANPPEKVIPTSQPELGIWMKAEREKAGMTVQTLAKKIKVPSKTIKAWENGEYGPISTRHKEKGPFDNQFDRWCKALGVDTEKINSEEDD